MVYYFAYGSNMKRNVMSDISVHSEEPAVLQNYKLIFDKVGLKRGTITGVIEPILGVNRQNIKKVAGFANIVKEKGQNVFGVLYEIDESNLDLLDKKEGVPTHYRREKVVATKLSDKKDIEAITYVATLVLRPQKKYLAVIIEGAREHNLPNSYIKQLEELRPEEISD